MKRYIVIGLGNFGSGVAEALHASGNEVIALDLDEAAVERVASFVSRAAVADGRDPRTLERLGAGAADAAVISTGDDITASVLTTLTLRDVGVRDIYVKVISREHARVMEKLGVSETVFPERESALRLGRRITNRSVLNYVQLGADFGIQEMAVPDRWVGRSLRELELPRHHRVSVIAVHDVLTDIMAPIPDPDAPLKESDTLLIAGREEHLVRVAQII
jgi:trk system potassium uptake protein TrkA